MGTVELGICSLMCGWWEVIIGLDKGQAPNRWQAIIWNNDDLVQTYIYA